MAVKVGCEYHCSPDPAKSCNAKHSIVASHDKPVIRVTVMDDACLVFQVQLSEDHGQDF